MAKRRVGRPVEPFELTAEEKQTLERWSRGRTVSQALARRARIVLGCAAGGTCTDVAQCWADHCGNAVADCYGPDWADATPGICIEWQRCREHCGECAISGTACTKPCDDAAPACAVCQKTLAPCYWGCCDVCFSD